MKIVKFAFCLNKILSNTFEEYITLFEKYIENNKNENKTTIFLKNYKLHLKYNDKKCLF